MQNGDLIVEIQIIILIKISFASLIITRCG